MVTVALILIMLAFTLESSPIWTGLRPLQPAFKRQIIYKIAEHIIDNFYLASMPILICLKIQFSSYYMLAIY